MDRPSKWVVLIGIDFYARGTARPGMEVPSLQGCVEDVTLVESFLRSNFNVNDSNLFKLTATPPADGSLNVPTESPRKRPTYENMIETFLTVTQQAESGDSVYIHYSGHGGRAQTIFAHLKQSRGTHLDEVLVPYDINSTGGRYLRDVEIAALFRGMVDKGLILAVVIDACHSAGATRNSSAATNVRGLPRADLNVLASDQCALPPDQLAFPSSLSPIENFRNAKRKNSWLIEPRGYTLLAAG